MSLATNPLRFSPGLRTTRPDATRLHRHISTPLLLIGCVKSGILRRRRATRAGCGADDAPGTSLRGGLDHDAIGIDIGEHNIDARQRGQVAHVELGVNRVLPHRLVVVNDPAISISETQRPQVARLESLDPVGRVLGDVSAIEDRVVHHYQTAPCRVTADRRQPAPR